MKLIVLSYEYSFPNELTLIHELFEEGLALFHLRKPTWSEEELYKYLKNIDPIYHRRIVLHDHYKLIESFSLKGIHCNVRNSTHWLESKQNGLQLSASFHSVEELKILTETFEYVFLSPVYDSISKENYHAAFSEEELKEGLNQNLQPDIIALGGINVERVDKCRDMGFDGVAVMGAVWKSKDPVLAFRKLRNTCQVNVHTY